jgi:ABC-type sugar transport system ATPase subunit
VSEHILELKSISKSFSGVEVLHHVSFALRPGEVHALLGENGAGKSTLVKVITGVHQPDSGEIYLDDKPMHFGDTRETRQAGITAIYQELSLFPDLGYLSVYAMHALATGEIKGFAGDKFKAGKLGEYTVKDDPDLGLNVLLGLPFIWNKDNIDASNW